MNARFNRPPPPATEVWGPQTNEVPYSVSAHYQSPECVVEKTKETLALRGYLSEALKEKVGPMIQVETVGNGWCRGWFALGEKGWAER